MKLDVPLDVQLLLENYAKQLSDEERFEVSTQQAFERLVRITLGDK